MNNKLWEYKVNIDWTNENNDFTMTQYYKRPYLFATCFVKRCSVFIVIITRSDCTLDLWVTIIETLRNHFFWGSSKLRRYVSRAYQHKHTCCSGVAKVSIVLRARHSSQIYRIDYYDVSIIVSILDECLQNNRATLNNGKWWQVS